MPKAKTPSRDCHAELMEIAQLSNDIETKQSELEQCRRQVRNLSAAIRELETDRRRAITTAKEANLFGDGPLAAHK